MKNINNEKDIRDIEIEEEYQDNGGAYPPSDIISFNELRSCSDLFRMYDNKQINIDPDFQRDLVWTNDTQTRFIDSLMKQLPIPSMCISLDYPRNKRIMIDGLQRISTIITFLGNLDWRLSKLDDIDPKISGKSVKEIKEHHNDLFSTLENVTLPVTVLRCDASKEDHLEYLFTIFHRLNTGGNKLTNQEIRNCIYSGSFNNLLKETVKMKEFKVVFGLEKDKKYRFRYEELLLRALTFFNQLDSYTGGLSKFLNKYMEQNRNPDAIWLNKTGSLFKRTIMVLYSAIDNSHLKISKFNKASLEALLVGIMSNIDMLENKPQDDILRMVNELLKHELFSKDQLKEGLSSVAKLKPRLKASITIFSK